MNNIVIGLSKQSKANLSWKWLSTDWLKILWQKTIFTTVLMEFSIHMFILNWKCGLKDKSNNESTLAAFILINEIYMVNSMKIKGPVFTKKGNKKT